MLKLKKINIEDLKQKLNLQQIRSHKMWKKIADLSVKDKLQKIKTALQNFRLSKVSFNIANLKNKSFSLAKWMTTSWKIVIVSIWSFFIFYYTVGGIFTENIDVQTTYKLPNEPQTKSATVQSLAFLVNREIDDKMWVANLPLLFPSYFLDNMPNFQIGIIDAVRDTTDVLRKLKINNEEQNKNLDEAHDYFKYSPNIWILSRTGKFSIAPSSNAQYRRGRKDLIKYNENGEFSANTEDFLLILNELSKRLHKQISKNDNYIQEKSGEWFDLGNDNLFFHNKGYAFALWQVFEATGFDYKNIILENDCYTDWSYLTSSLRKASEFNPIFVRSGNLNAEFSANHLLTQNFYLMRAIYYIEKIKNIVADKNYASQN